MIDLTREDLVSWLESPFTKGFYKVLKHKRNIAEDRAFTCTLDNYKKSALYNRDTNELFAYRNLEVLNSLIMETFEPLYQDLQAASDILASQNPGEEEIKLDDSLQNFINQILDKND